MAYDKYTALNIKIRNTLIDIIEHTYKDSEKLADYKKFYIQCLPKKIKSYAGLYKAKERTIEIVGLERDVKHIVVTTLHELTHHIDYCNRNTSDHSQVFYQEFEKLIHTALNMKIFEPEDITNIQDVTDRNKVAKMVERWVPEYIKYKEAKKTIRVYNCFEQKEILKSKLYRWQGADKSWEKIVIEDEVATELDFLRSILPEENIKVASANELEVKVSGYIIAGNGSFEKKDILKQEGFFFDAKGKKKVWKKSVTGNIKEQVDEYRRKIPGVEFDFML